MNPEGCIFYSPAMFSLPLHSSLLRSLCAVVYCQWLEVLRVDHGPQISSSDVTDMLSSGGLTHLRSLSFLFTPLSPKALHHLSSEWRKESTHIYIHYVTNKTCNGFPMNARPLTAFPELFFLNLTLIFCHSHFRPKLSLFIMCLATIVHSRRVLPLPLLGSCPKLNDITLHISPNTYFPGSSTDSVILKKFHQIHSNFQVRLLLCDDH